VIGAVLVNAVKFWLSAAAPELWPFILSGLIVLVVLVFPNGLVDLAKLKLVRPISARQLSSETPELH
jgi:urea transport system permease protein